MTPHQKIVLRETTNILRILLKFKGVFSELKVDEEGVLRPMLVDGLPSTQLRI